MEGLVMKAGKRVYWIIGALVALAAVIYYLNAAGGTEVEIVKIEAGDILKTVVDTGYVQSASAFDLYSDQGGRVEKIMTAIGEPVKRGQVLMTLINTGIAVESDQARLQLTQAEAAVAAAESGVAGSQLDLNNTQKDLERMEKLLAAGAVSQAQYDATLLLRDKYQKDYQQQVQNLNAARQQAAINQQLLNNLAQKQEQLEIKSPVDGTLTQLPVKTGQVVLAAAVLARVAQTNKLEIKADILSDDLAEVTLGQKVKITAPVLGEKIITGAVTKIYPEAEEKQSALGVIQRRVPVIITLNETANLKPGYETRVSIQTVEKKNILIIPRESVLTTPDNRKQVMLITDGRVHHRYIQTGLSDSSNLEIIKGLKKGDQIIKDASLELKENARVKVKQ
jgi:HlyD family secretion protein